MVMFTGYLWKGNFPTTTDELDILKFKGPSIFNDSLLLTNID